MAYYIGSRVPKNVHDYDEICHTSKEIKAVSLEDAKEQAWEFLHQVFITPEVVKITPLFRKGRYSIGAMTLLKKVPNHRSGGIEDI